MEWLVILAVVLVCPLMHFWMMRGEKHGGHDQQKNKHSKKGCCH